MDLEAILEEALEEEAIEASVATLVEISDGSSSVVPSAKIEAGSSQGHTETITITFSDVSEHSVGMHRVSKQAKTGFSVAELKEFRKYFESHGCQCEMIDLKESLQYAHVLVDTENAAVLVVRGGVKAFGANPDTIMRDLMKTEWDTKRFFNGKQVTKLARHSLYFGDYSCEPDLTVKKNRVVAFNKVEGLYKIQQVLNKMFSYRDVEFTAEGDRFYDIEKCGVAPCGDLNKRMVVGVHLGVMTRLAFAWHYQGVRYSKPVVLELHHGDVYVMSSKAVGWDSKRVAIATLKHASGAQNFIEML